ncbi:hypothetical protein HR45_17145 [Shewanella mangrovi]|uniref:Serine aminopeptidase S33 domain-containing protein n=1 Tax=Shewanella mangrovi TaxID=1515746 RepID=A0A094JAP0_9GAMM|nr:alpha/beta fold hydrolase [Shewanella mangrovi]KFZ36292.1 hypothetical protein HR45_17145 [Shewanella mangrovi]
MMAKFSSRDDRPVADELLSEFWLQVSEASITTTDGCQIAYCSVTHPQSEKAVVISNGRVESYLKYAEVIYQLHQQGFSVYALDHVGQGLSSRLTDNPHIGHIDKFSRYVEHFTEFMTQVVLPQKHGKHYLLGHSMGCAIGALYLEQHRDQFNAVAFCAPMFGIKLPMPAPWVKWLAQKLNHVSEGKKPNYIPGGKDYHAKPFYGNPLTHSRQRYCRLLALYQQVPQIQLGSPSNQWLLEALDGAHQACEVTKRLSIPTLILQATRDKVVDNAAQWRACGPQTELQQIEGARHEILIEHDYCRTKGLELILNWFSS